MVEAMNAGDVAFAHLIERTLREALGVGEGDGSAEVIDLAARRRER